MSDLHMAAKAVLDRWHNPKWQWRHRGRTADLMNALQRAVEAAPAAAPALAVTDHGWNLAFERWWLSRPRARQVLSPEGFARFVWRAACKAMADGKECGNAIDCLTWVSPTPSTMPDVNEAVLLELLGDGEPTWMGTWDGKVWRYIDADLVTSQVTGWARMPRGRAR